MSLSRPDITTYSDSVMSSLAMMVAPRGKLLRLTTLVSRASCCSGNAENRGTLRRSSIDTLGGAVIWSVLPGKPGFYQHILADSRRPPHAAGPVEVANLHEAASGGGAIQPGY